MHSTPNSRRNSLAIATLAVAALGFTPAAHAQLPPGRLTAIDRYVAAPDPSYQWKVAHEAKLDGATLFIVDMISQTWRAPHEVDRTKWQHWVLIVVPDEVRYETGFMFIGGGDNDDAMPTRADPFLVEMARGTGSVVAEVRMIPNQPLTFVADDNVSRVEDNLIAHTWIKYCLTGDPTWPARNPMTKAVVRAMDTVTALMKSNRGGGRTVNKFVAAGGSKRGWTTWITGAVDDRVVAIAPIVIDVLNVEVSMRHHFAAYGYWAPAIGDYYRNGFMRWMDTPEHALLMKLVDPFEYRARYATRPKFIINATGDQFFLPDSSQFYFDDLPGEKYLRYVPNTDHGLKGSDARESLYAFYESVLTGATRPRFTWTFDGADTITVKAQTKPLKVDLWQATNPEARDFRVLTIGNAYKATELSDSGGGAYVGKVEPPAEGFTAFFIELTFDSGGRVPLKFSTPVRVTPDKLPFKDKPIDIGP